MNEKPIHPGKVFKEGYINNKCTVGRAAEILGVTRQTVSHLISEHRDLSPEMAIRIARATHTDPWQWWRMQNEIDLWEAMQKDLTVEDGKLC